ncbi:hypothetical protein SR39_25290 [Methylobacterium radiotolerans]|nr:hypothetical protein SR39_25290 [Methylobacterium radiotolerans]
MRFSIKAKLGVGFGAILVLLGAASGVGYQRLTAADATMKYVLSRAEVQKLVLEGKANAIRAGFTSAAPCSARTRCRWRSSPSA